MINVIRVQQLTRNRSKSSSYQCHRHYNFRLGGALRRPYCANAVADYLLEGTFTTVITAYVNSNYEAISFRCAERCLTLSHSPPEKVITLKAVNFNFHFQFRLHFARPRDYKK